MARVTHTPKALTVGYPTLQPPANSLDVAFLAADTVNDEQVVHTGKEMILAQNTDAGAQTVTITSVAINGRTGDVTAYSIGAGEFAYFGPYPTKGFRQTNGFLYFEASSALVKFLVFKLP